MRFDQVEKLLLCAQQLVCASAIEACGLAVVHKADKLDSGVMCLTDLGSKCQALVVHADNDGAPQRTLQFEQHRGKSAQHQTGAKLAQRSDP